MYVYVGVCTYIRNSRKMKTCTNNRQVYYVDAKECIEPTLFSKKEREEIYREKEKEF